MNSYLTTYNLKFRIYPDAESKAYIDTAFNTVRAAYNQILAVYIWQRGLHLADPDQHPKPSTTSPALNRILTQVIAANQDGVQSNPPMNQESL